MTDGEPRYFQTRFNPGDNKSLACRTVVADDDLAVFVPEESRELSTEVQISPEAGKGDFPQKDSVVQVRRVTLKEPTLDNNVADAERLIRTLENEVGGSCRIDFSVLRSLPSSLRNCEWEPEVGLSCADEGWMVTGVAPDIRPPWAMAVDIGTTMIKARLLGPDGRWSASCANSQALYGPDVITRIMYCEQNEGGLTTLQKLAVDDITRLRNALTEAAGLEKDEAIQGLVLSGNTTMIHLCLGLDPRWIRREPYVGCTFHPPRANAEDVGLPLDPPTSIYPLPSAASYVGADITAGVMATGLADSPAPRMLIDLGTNGEIVVGNEDFLLCCSASAGPAFEGGGCASGTWAREGAICEVWEENGTGWASIGDMPPVGICGSGYIDLIAALLRTGMIDKTGSLVEDASPRIEQTRTGPRYVLVEADKAGVDRDVILTQADIDNLVRAKGAIYGAANILLDRIGMSWDDMDTVMLAGGFGENIHVDNAVTIGLLPDVDRSKIRFVGNTSLEGAVLAAENCDNLRRMHDIASSMTYFELSTTNDFMDEFVSACFLPHTDGEKFPSVSLGPTECAGDNV
ncbi:MAG: ASKHA domain-containing protein [Planctomycetota bacterium]